MDFFARTEMDKHTHDAHSEYKRAVEAFVTHLAAKKTLDEFANTDITGDPPVTELPSGLDKRR